ncbi:hypothetical protein GCM10027022_14140 [Alpinimonas psychrophila]
MQGIPVLIGVDGNRGNATIFRGPNNTNGNFATIGNEDLFDARHRSQPIQSTPVGVVSREQKIIRVVADAYKPRGSDASGRHEPFGLKNELVAVPEIRPEHVEASGQAAHRGHRDADNR